MAIQAEREGDTLVAKAEGRIDGTNARQFQDDLDSVIEEGDRAVILNFQDLMYISSAGIRVVLMTAKSLQRREARFALCSLSEPVREIFEVSGFDKIIPIHSSQDEAISALGG
jgi:stage II sporulation protein AA (anti-sigma F factor antagonist)